MKHFYRWVQHIKQGIRGIKGIIILILATSSCLLHLFLQGCSSPEFFNANAEESVPSRFVMVLLDETESFAEYDDNGSITTRFWPEVLPYICGIVNGLQSGDTFGIIGIDDKGFETNRGDVRMLYTLNESLARAHIEKKTLKKKVRELKPRKEIHRATDILGALSHSAYCLSQDNDNAMSHDQQNRERIVFVFSDMIQEPNMPIPRRIRDLKFPENTRIYCFYVNARGKANWNTITNIWGSIFKQAGVTEYKFFQRAGTRDRLNEIIQKWSQ